MPLKTGVRSMTLLDHRFLRRTLLLLLVVRVIAAPISLRRAPACDPSRGPLVVRVCSWPLPTAWSRSDKLTIGDTTDVPGTAQMHPGCSHLDARASLRILFLPSDNGYTRLSPDRLRC